MKRLEFSYDAKGRRIAKRVFTNQRQSNGDLVNGSWTFVQETVFLWQDWTLLAEFVRSSPSGSFGLRRSYLWGLDVDGTFGGAGGVGGLLWVAEYVPGQSSSHRQLAPWYDGNGNIMGWLEKDGSESLPLYRLEYDPYGKLLVEETVRVERNQKQRDLNVDAEWLTRPPFAFSTKYEDAESGLLYYGYRYYAPEMQRWLSRDPIGEHGGVNLQVFCVNNPVNFIDTDGRLTGAPTTMPATSNPMAPSPNSTPFRSPGNNPNSPDYPGSSPGGRSGEIPAPVDPFGILPPGYDPTAGPEPHKDPHFPPEPEYPKEKPKDKEGWSAPHAGEWHVQFGAEKKEKKLYRVIWTRLNSPGYGSGFVMLSQLRDKLPNSIRKELDAQFVKAGIYIQRSGGISAFRALSFPSNAGRCYHLDLEVVTGEAFRFLHDY